MSPRDSTPEEVRDCIEALRQAYERERVTALAFGQALGAERQLRLEVLQLSLTGRSTRNLVILHQRATKEKAHLRATCEDHMREIERWSRALEDALARLPLENA